MPANGFGPFVCPGIPSATFFPSTSIVSPFSFGAVNLHNATTRSSVSIPQRQSHGNTGDAPCLDETKRDSVGAHAEAAPLLADGLGETNHRRLRRGIVRLADVAMQAGRRRDVNNRPVLSVSLQTLSATNPPRAAGVDTHLDAHMGRRGADEPEGRADVHAEDDIEGIVGRRVQHAVVREAGVVHDVINLAVLPTGTSADALGSLDIECELCPLETHLIVAVMTFSGKSSAPTSPPTASASPPASLISSTTSCAFFSSRLR